MPTVIIQWYWTPLFSTTSHNNSCDYDGCCQILTLLVTIVFDFAAFKCKHNNSVVYQQSGLKGSNFSLFYNSSNPCITGCLLHDSS